MQLPKPMIPDLTAETTTNQDMVHGLNLLVTQDISRRILKAMPKSPLCCPAMSVHHQPEEETNLRWSQCLPDVLGPKRSREPNKHYPISGRRWVRPICRQSLGEGVQRVREVDALQTVIEAVKLHHHLHRQRCNKVSNPTLVMKCLSHRGTPLPWPNASEDRRGEVSDSWTIEPTVRPEERRFTVA